MVTNNTIRPCDKHSQYHQTNMLDIVLHHINHQHKCKIYMVPYTIDD